MISVLCIEDMWRTGVAILDLWRNHFMSSHLLVTYRLTDFKSPIYNIYIYILGIRMRIMPRATYSLRR